MATRGQNKKRKGNKTKSIFKKTLKIILLAVLVIGFSASVCVGFVFYGYIKDAPELDFNKLVPFETSYIYDINDREVTSLYQEQNRILIDLEDIPQIVQDAFIAIEDERFYEHHGFDPIGILRAFYTNLRHKRIEQGGSTITQQLVKRVFLSPEQNYKRKVQEIWLAINLERQFTKEEILELYLNEIYFGNGAYGIEAASNTYFGKSVNELELHEAALLAGIPRSPNYYNPRANRDITEARARTVLKKMLDLEKITEAEYQEAVNKEFVYFKPPSREYPYPHFIDHVVHSELIDILSSLPGNEHLEVQKQREKAYHMIYTQGIRVYTTLDPTIQTIAEAAMANEEYYPESIPVNMTALNAELQRIEEKINAGELPRSALKNINLKDFIDEGKGVLQPQAGLVVADPSTGEVKALVGGREYRRGIDENRRFISRRQPGSAIKPLTSYAPAFEEGILTPGSIIDDSPFARADLNWYPENYSGTFRGLVAAREALVHSLNIPAVRVFEKLTPQVGTAYAKKFGISTFTEGDTSYLSTALGGLTNGVTAWDMTQAYSVLANQGIKNELYTVRRIEDRNGKVIYEHDAEPEAVISPQTAYLITDILKDVVRRGTGTGLNIGRPIAAKTGTTNERHTAYLCAYTPELVAAVWIGYDKEILGAINNGWRYTTALLKEVFIGALKDVPAKDFERPSGLSGPVAICSKSGLRPSENCPDRDIIYEIFPSGNIPQKTCDMHVKVEVCTESGLLPTKFCPPDKLAELTFLKRPEFIITDNNWARGAGRGPEDAKQMPPTEFCELHTNRPAPPTAFEYSFVAGGKGIKFNWTPGDENTVRYRLFRSVVKDSEEEGEEKEEILTTTSSLSYTDRSFEPGTRYRYRLVAINAEGGYSEGVTLIIDIAHKNNDDKNDSSHGEGELPEDPGSKNENDHNGDNNGGKDNGEKENSEENVNNNGKRNRTSSIIIKDWLASVFAKINTAFLVNLER